MQLSPPVFNNHVILGLWPIAGITTVGVTRKDAITTIETAIDVGIRAFDTAYSYGMDGESDRYLGEVLGKFSDKDRFHVIGKVGQRYQSGRRVIDGRPESLRRDAKESLRRLQVERFGTLMLHSIDEQIPIEQSAAALGELREEGFAQSIGLCNGTPQQRAQFASSSDCRAIQCPLNLLQRDRLSDVIPDAANDQCDVLVYWTLMKGLLAGKIERDHSFAPGDSRPNYAIFLGQAREKAHAVVDGLKIIANDQSTNVAALAVSWTLSQPGVTAALVGARRPEQIKGIADATVLDENVLMRIERLLNPN